MSKSNAHENAILLLEFNAVAIADLAENDTTSPATTLTVALHTADPGETGDQSANVPAYAQYANVTVARSGAGWVVTGNSVSPAADIVFPQATGATTPEVVTHFSVGTGVANNIMRYGTVTPNINIAEGVQPVLDTATAITED